MKLFDLHEEKKASSGMALSKIVSYISRKIGVELLRIPGVEHFHNSKENGYGLRYVEAGSTRCIRLNWNSGSAASGGKISDLSSIDVFSGKNHDPTYTISTKGISIVHALPMVVAMLQDPSIGKHFAFPVSAEMALSEAVLLEVARDEYTSEGALTDFLHQLASGKSFTRSEFIQRYHIVHVGIFDTIYDDFADRFIIRGKRISLASNQNLDSLKDSILSKAGVVEVSKGGTKEVYFKSPQEEELEKEGGGQKVPYADTLEHLEGLVQALIKGSFNALFVAGKGGTGKTQTVERVLHSAGLTDGHGYYKNTGSASAAGVYTLLYHHRNDIILFDDSDGALADQDARNLIKAATDTKKSRKLVWNKRSSFIFDPESEDPDAYEGDLSMAPKYFDFKGRIIFISNLPLNKLDPDGALRTRAFIINVDPTDDEMFDYMGKILDDIKLEDGLTLSKEEKEHVLTVVKTSKRKGDVSLRKLVRALNLAASGAPNWEKLVELYA